MESLLLLLLLLLFFLLLYIVLSFFMIIIRSFKILFFNNRKNWSTLFKKLFEEVNLFRETFLKYPLRFITIGIIVLILLLWSNPLIKYLAENNNIKYKNSGNYCYYLEVIDKNNKKQYYSASIYVAENGALLFPSNNSVFDNHDSFYIDKIYSDNYKFEKIYFYDEPVYLSRYTTYYYIPENDDYEESYEIKLLNKTGFCPGLKENSFLENKSEIVLMSVSFLMVMLFYVDSIYNAITKKEEL